jgi:predicted transcriptional regulator
VARNTTSVRLPDELLEALDRRAAARGLTRSQLIVEAVEQALEDCSSWSPRFLKAIGTPRPELDGAVDEMLAAIQRRRSRKGAPDL